jgi:hypothetical protein
MKINDDKTQAPEAHLTLNGWKISFNNVKYLGVISEKRIKRRLHIEMIEAKAFRKFIRVWSLFKSKLLNTNIQLA